MAFLEAPVKGPNASIVKASQRLNPCMELDVDVLAVTRAAQASTAADWNAGVLTSTSPDTRTGVLRLTPTTPATLFSQTNTASVQHPFKDSVDGVEEYALDFFPDPSVTQGVSFTLDSLDLFLSAGNLKGFFRVQVSYYDQFWRAVPMGDPIDILSGDVVIAVGAGGIYKIDFTALGRRFVFLGGAQNTVTGSGRDSGGAQRTSNVDPKTGRSNLLNIARGLSISIQPMGRNFASAYIGLVPNATAAQFDTNSFWRVAANRNCGPYNPENQPYVGGDTGHNPDNYLVTGAVPGFGAKAVTNGTWGIARRIPTAQRGQNPLYTWEQPYHVLRVLAYPSTGSAVNVLDMGAQPTNPVELRLDDWQQQGTSLAYSLKGSNTSAAGPWTAITANTDGSILTGADLYEWYQLTTTFTPGPSGATKYASPALQAWSMVERIALSTYRYLREIDTTMTADPVTAQSSIAELKLPVMNAGRQDFRDLATQLGSNYAPSGLEAHVYARNTRSGVRAFLNAFRLENRNPSFGVEEMVFVSGLDRLTVKIPSPIETFRYPASGQVAITNVTHVGAVYTITVGGTPFTIGALVGYRMHGVTGTCAGLDFTILSNPTTSQFTINVATGAIPAIGDTIEIHSDVTTRVGASYVAQDYAAVYADLLGVQAAVPARYRGRLPATTGRTTSYTLPSDGVKALDVLQHVALHCGGFPIWDKGRIQFVDLYGKKDSVVTWDDRHIVTLETPVGADRRMPRVRVSYGYQSDTQRFTNQATYDDFDTLLGWGPANLFDVYEPNADFCKWNDASEAAFVSAMLLKAWKSGVRLWKVKTVLNWPLLSQGDAVSIITDQYTDRRLSYSADGLTDFGVPVAGRTAALAVIVGRNLWGNEFIVAIRGLDQITSAPVATLGSVTGQAAAAKPPTVSISFDSRGQVMLNSTGDAATVSQIYTLRIDRAPTDVEVRAGTPIASQSAVALATGVYLNPGHPVWFGAFAYNSQGAESSLASGEVVRQGGAFDPHLKTPHPLHEEEFHRAGNGGFPVPGGRVHAIPIYDDSGMNPLLDTKLRRVGPLLQGNDGEPGVESQRAATRKGAQAAGSGAHGITEEEATRGSAGGFGAPGSRFHSEPLFDSSGGIPLTDPLAREILPSFVPATGYRVKNDFAVNNAGGSTQFGMNRHNDQQIGINAASKTFGVSFDAIPQIRAIPQSFLLPGTNSTVDRVVEFMAKNVTVAGYDIRGVYSTGSSSSPQTETWATTLNGTPAASQTIQNNNAAVFCDLSNANSNLTTYTARFDVNTAPMNIANTLFVSLYKNNGTGSTSWTLVASRSYNANQILTNETLAFAAAMALDWDVRIVITYQTSPLTLERATVVARDVTYPKITPGTEVDMTTGTGNGIVFQAMEAP